MARASTLIIRAPQQWLSSQVSAPTDELTMCRRPSVNRRTTVGDGSGLIHWTGRSRCARLCPEGSRSDVSAPSVIISR